MSLANVEDGQGENHKDDGAEAGIHGWSLRRRRGAPASPRSPGIWSDSTASQGNKWQSISRITVLELGGVERAQRLRHRHRSERRRLCGQAEGRGRNRYKIQHHLLLRYSISREPTTREVLDLLVKSNTRPRTRKATP